MFFFFSGERCFLGGKTSFAQTLTRGGEAKVESRGSCFRRKKNRKRKAGLSFLFFFLLSIFSLSPSLFSLSPCSSPHKRDNAPSTRKKRKNINSKFSCFVACFCVSLFGKKKFPCFFVQKEDQRATEEEKEKPLSLLHFPRFLPLTVAILHLQAGDDVRARGRGRREIVVDLVVDDALRVVERVDRRDRGSHRRDERSLGLDVAADGRDLDADGLDVDSLGLDVSSDRTDVDEAGLLGGFWKKRGRGKKVSFFFSFEGRG